MMQLLLKNDDSSLCNDVINTHQKFGDFSCIFDYDSRIAVFRDFISPIIDQCDLAPGARMAPPADT